MANLRPVVLFACALIILFPLSAHGNQLLLEAGFEPPACSGGHWMQNTLDYACVSMDSHTGTWSMRGIETNPASLGRFFQNVSLTPGNWYTIDGWIKTDGVSGGGVVLGLAYITNLGTTPADGYIIEIGGVSGITDWTYYKSAPFQLGAMPADAWALAFYGEFNNATGQAWWDDVSLDPVPEPASLLLLLSGLGLVPRLRRRR